MNKRSTLSGLTKEELELNLVFKTLRSSDIDDCVDDEYDKFSCEDLSEEDIHFLLDKLSNNLHYATKYMKMYSCSSETVYLIAKRKELAEDFLDNEYGMLEIINCGCKSISRILEIFFNYDFGEDRLIDFMVRIFEKAKEESDEDDFSYFKRSIRRTHSNIQEVENFLTKIKTIYALG